MAGLPFGLGVGLAVLLRALAALVLGRMDNFGAITAAAISIGILESGIRWNTGDDYLVAPILAALIIVALLVQRRGATRADRDESSSWTGHAGGATRSDRARADSARCGWPAPVRSS